MKWYDRPENAGYVRHVGRDECVADERIRESAERHTQLGLYSFRYQLMLSSWSETPALRALSAAIRLGLNDTTPITDAVARAKWDRKGRDAGAAAAEVLAAERGGVDLNGRRHDRGADRAAAAPPRAPVLDDETDVEVQS